MKKFRSCILLLVILSGSIFACPPEKLNSQISAYTIPDPSPRVGDQKILMILADFSDAPGAYPQESFYNLFFGNNPTGSFSDYYQEVSYRQLRYSGDVIGLTSGNVTKNATNISYVRLPNPKSFYANNSGGNDVSAFPKNAAGLYYHAIQELDNVNFNFKPYADENGILRNVIVIVAGHSASESRNFASDINAQHYSIEYALSGGYRTKDGMLLKTFSICPEKEHSEQATIGICTHEQGHALGLPDLYDHAYKKTVGAFWDLMAAGTFGGYNGKRPFHLSAFSKIKLGWITPTLPSSKSFKLPPVETTPVVLKLATDINSKEYFLIENRQEIGFDDRMMVDRQLCPGAIIWHIDENTYDQYLSINKVNTDTSLAGPTNPSISIVERDGDAALLNFPLSYGACTDTYQTGSYWNDKTPGNSKFWDGSSSGLKIAVGSSQSRLDLNISFVEPLIGKIKLTQSRGIINGTLTFQNIPTDLIAELWKKSNNQLVKKIKINNNRKFSFKKIKKGSYRVIVQNLSAVINLKK